MQDDKFVTKKGDITIHRTLAEVRAQQKKNEEHLRKTLKALKEQENPAGKRDAGFDSPTPRLSSSGAIGILDLLKHHGFDPPEGVKFVRHQQRGVDLEDYLRRGWLEPYQAFQHRPLFDKVRYIVAFIGAGRTRARFIGVYEILGRKPGSEGELPEGFPDGHAAGWRTPEYFYYPMVKARGFEELELRVVVEWGKAAISWSQWATNKEVVELLPKGSLWKPFDDYLGFTLTYSELKSLCDRPEANVEWCARLRGVAGIYLILDTQKGQQYVGSAYGAEGIWGRWEYYAKTKHGGNKLLKALVDNDEAYPDAFQYSILQVLPTSMAREEVIKREGQYKKKLGSKARLLSDGEMVGGLNAN